MNLGVVRDLWAPVLYLFLHVSMYACLNDGANNHEDLLGLYCELFLLLEQRLRKFAKLMPWRLGGSTWSIPGRPAGMQPRQPWSSVSFGSILACRILGPLGLGSRFRVSESLSVLRSSPQAVQKPSIGMDQIDECVAQVGISSKVERQVHKVISGLKASF